MNDNNMKNISSFDKYIKENFNWKYEIELRDIISEYQHDLPELVSKIKERILDHSDKIESVFGKSALDNIKELVEDLYSYGDSDDEEFDHHFDNLMDFSNDIRLLIKAENL